MTDMPDEYLTEVLPVVKKIAAASGAENWNLLQNNGREAHQEVDHVSTLLSTKGFWEGWVGRRWVGRLLEKVVKWGEAAVGMG